MLRVNTCSIKLLSLNQCRLIIKLDGTHLNVISNNMWDFNHNIQWKIDRVCHCKCVSTFQVMAWWHLAIISSQEKHLSSFLVIMLLLWIIKWIRKYNAFKINVTLPRPPWINSLWLSDTRWRQRSGSTLIQVMACCLTAPSHYLNQCWLIICGVNSTGNAYESNHYNAFENYFFKIKVIIPTGQWVKLSVLLTL